jgi:hypothetical protein
MPFTEAARLGATGAAEAICIANANLIIFPPEGRQQISPEQRPGEMAMMNSHVLGSFNDRTPVARMQRGVLRLCRKAHGMFVRERSR